MLRTAFLLVFPLALAPALAAQSAMGALPAGSMPARISWELASPPGTPELVVGGAPANLRAADASARDLATRATQVSSDSVAFPDPGEDGARVELGLEARFQPSTDFSADPGSVTTARGGWNGRIAWRSGASSSLTVGMRTEASFYDFSGASGLVPSPGNDEPVNDVLLNRLAATWCARLGERTSWFASGVVTLAGEDSTGLADSTTLGAVAGMRHRPAESIEFQYGLAALSRLEDSTWVFPYFGFDWRIDDDLRLSTEGAKIELALDVAEAWTLYGNALYDLREYRLNDENPLPEGALRDHEIDLGLGVRWRPSGNVRVELGAGIAAWREIEFRSAAGDTVSESEADPGLLGQFSIQVDF